jgi:hypothetical protein
MQCGMIDFKKGCMETYVGEGERETPGWPTAAPAVGCITQTLF